MPKHKLINLLPQEEFEASTFGRVIRWAMGSFRIIVIVTEMIVMAAFLSRFWLDAQNSNLTDSIKVATAQIHVQNEFEKQFRGLQAKLSIFKQIAAQPKDSERISSVASKVPQDITLSSITIHDSDGEIKGSSGSEFSIAQYISNLKTDPLIKRVDLGSTNSSDNTSSQILFQLNLTY